MESSEFNRRDFIRGGSIATLMTFLGGVEISAQTEPAKPAAADDSDRPKVNCGIIGFGNWGREIVATLARLPQARVGMVSDNYEATLKRAAKAAPGATAVKDYRKILDNQDIQAVLVATPSHQHKDIVIAALQAGKHVYCEAPLATTIDDARAIAKAAKASPRQYFQAGLLYRSDPQRHFLLPFIRAGALGKTVMARAQWHKKQSWRATSPNPAREQEMNWRLNNATSGGLICEYGIHQLDSAGWFIGERPVAITGFGSVLFWKDGREVPDTIQALVEFPGGVNLIYHATLANSFDSEYEMYHGSDAAVMLRDGKAWMFKEVDAPLLGWEVYANKDSFYKETGIALSANATKLNKTTGKPGESDTPTPLFSALDAFVTNANEIGTAVEDFKASYDIKDTKALTEYLANIKKQPGAGYQEALDAVIIAIKANEAILKGQKVNLPKELFEPV
ncbi:MAG: Gfo/Idh/MocA family oxidoreductase [Verrucomicrobiota bacterium]